MKTKCACRSLPPALCIIQQMTPCRDMGGTHVFTIWDGVRLSAERCLDERTKRWYYGNVRCNRCDRELPIYRESQS